jgi:hypothetical protein
VSSLAALWTLNEPLRCRTGIRDSRDQMMVMASQARLTVWWARWPPHAALSSDTAIAHRTGALDLTMPLFPFCPAEAPPRAQTRR